ncbi:alpha/beta-hydrolase [Ascobolus immersus RN42]|uniref:Cutinase n=1 Tax=Ascobolus immersus RN42 TaxID=1160509 RepID=A0A3N4HQL2_ASCIM|nr:alpha/beta-hydrolase [Ascobolus immersus RN42]
MVRLTPSFVLLTTLLTRTVTAQKTWAECEDIHIFVARGGNEPYEMVTPAGSRQQWTVKAICNTVAPYGYTCGYEDIVFPDAFVGDYCGHVQFGVDYGREALQRYAERCPDSKLVLSGYSLGGHVVGDILGGGGGEGMIGGCTMERTEGMPREGLVGQNRGPPCPVLSRETG